MDWLVKTKYYTAQLEIVWLEYVASFVEEEIQELGSVDCIIYEF